MTMARGREGVSCSFLWWQGKAEKTMLITVGVRKGLQLKHESSMGVEVELWNLREVLVLSDK